MLFTIDAIIEHVSKFITLKIGDVIYTGTPSGVGKLAVGDRLVAEREGRELINMKIK